MTILSERSKQRIKQQIQTFLDRGPKFPNCPEWEKHAPVLMGYAMGLANVSEYVIDLPTSGIPPNAVIFFRDGDLWVCVQDDFLNLAESTAGFGRTFEEAYNSFNDAIAHPSTATDPSSYPKVEFGAGGSKPPGWITHDSDVDITKKLPYADGSVGEIRAEHVCEHVRPAEFLDFLYECKRILVVGGSVRICMPVLDRLDRQHAEDIIRGHGHQGAYTTELIGHFLRIVGFSRTTLSPRHPYDHHGKVITYEKDDLETARWVGVK